jgi:hypothetical protein
MAQTFLTNASTSPFTFPASYFVSGHTVELIGPGGRGGAGTTGTSGIGGAGGGGGGYYKGTYASGAITPGTTTIPFVIPAGGAAASTVWQTATNGQTAGGGGNGSTTVAGAAGAAGVNVGSPTIVYTLNTGNAGGIAGAFLSTGGGGGGGGAAGPNGAGGAGHVASTLSGGGGGGGNNGVTGNSAGLAGGAGQSGAAGSTSGTSGTGSSGGAGLTGTATSGTAGSGGSSAELDATHGPGGGGGGSAGNSANSANACITGAGGSYGGGSGGQGYSRGTLTGSIGAAGGGLIVITANSITTLSPPAGTCNIDDGTIAPVARFQFKLNPAATAVGLSAAAPTVAAAAAPLTPASVGGRAPSALFHFDSFVGIFPDSSGNGHFASPVGDCVLSSAQSKFGGFSAGIGTVSGSGSFTLEDHPDYTFGAGDFTVDLWAWLDPTFGGNFHLFDNGTSDGTDFTLFTSFGALWFRANGAVQIQIGAQFTTTAFPNGTTWYHVALTRASGITRLFINGVQGGGDLVDSTVYTRAAGTTPGCGNGFSTSSPGYIDELRVIKGYAAWTSNFTPPAAPYAAPGLSLSASTPTISVAAVSTNITPSGGSLALSTAAPRAQSLITDTPAATALGLSTAAPALTIAAAATLAPAAAALALTLQTPTAAIRLNLSPAAVALAVATASPTVGAGAGVPASVLLLLHFDGANASTSFPDASGRNHIITPSGAAQVETTQPIFAAGAGVFPSSGDYISADGSSDFSFGVGDFTIDQRVRFDALADYTIADWAPGPQIRIKSDGHAVYAIGGVDRITSAAALSVNTSYHVAVTRASGTTRLFINGAPEASTYVASDVITAGASRPIFGGRSAPSYVGPGDIIPGATVFCGMRAYTAASIGSNVATIRRSSDNTSKTFVSIAGGGINTSDPFFDGSTYWITTLFDQTGNGNDVIGVGISNPGPFFLLAGGSAGRPCADLISGDNEFLWKSTGAGLGSQPNSASVVFSNTGGAGNVAVLTMNDGASGNTAYHVVGVDNASSGTVYLYAGAVFELPCSLSAWHSVQGLFNGASSDLMIDGAMSTGGGVGTQPGGPGNLIVGGAQSVGSFFNGLISEIMFWHGDKSASFAALSANQRAYWGF